MRGKDILLFCAGVLFACLCLPLQAQKIQKKVIDLPSFVSTNTKSIVIKRIVLSDEQTQLDAVVYGSSGSSAHISPQTYLLCDGVKYPLREVEGLSMHDMVNIELIPESGEKDVTLSFAPIPLGAHQLNFVEPEERWQICQIQLARSLPYVFVPEFLQTRQYNQDYDLPQPELLPGRAVLNGYLLGYEETLDIQLQIEGYDVAANRTFKRPIRVKKDGSFHVELLLPSVAMARLQVNVASLPVLLMPNEETTVYLHLPNLSMSAFPLFESKLRDEKKAWFDGFADVVNTELASGSESMAVIADLPCKDRQRKIKHEERWLERRSGWSEATKTIVRINRLTELEPCIPSAELSEEDNRLLASPMALYAFHYRKGQAWNPTSLIDLDKAEQLLAQLQGGKIILADVKKKFSDITSMPLRKYITMVADRQMLAMTDNVDKGTVTVKQLPEDTPAAEMLAVMAQPFANKLVLFDFWATWCAPCKKSFVAMRPLRKQWGEDRVAYIYVTGPSSPVELWEKEIKQMSGTHYRLSEQQWAALCRYYHISAIPAYVLLNGEGEKVYQHLGFPGVDILNEELMKAQ